MQGVWLMQMTYVAMHSLYTNVPMANDHELKEEIKGGKSCGCHLYLTRRWTSEEVDTCFLVNISKGNDLNVCTRILKIYPIFFNFGFTIYCGWIVWREGIQNLLKNEYVDFVLFLKVRLGFRTRLWLLLWCLFLQV